MSSTSWVQAIEIVVGATDVTVIVGGGLGGLVSGGVVWLTVLLIIERFPAMSTA